MKYEELNEIFLTIWYYPKDIVQHQAWDAQDKATV